jgi:hypothetical protein
MARGACVGVYVTGHLGQVATRFKINFRVAAFFLSAPPNLIKTPCFKGLRTVTFDQNHLALGADQG